MFLKGKSTAKSCKAQSISTNGPQFAWKRNNLSYGKNDNNCDWCNTVSVLINTISNTELSISENNGLKLCQYVGFYAHQRVILRMEKVLVISTGFNVFVMINFSNNISSKLYNLTYETADCKLHPNTLITTNKTNSKITFSKVNSENKLGWTIFAFWHNTISPWKVCSHVTQGFFTLNYTLKHKDNGMRVH